MPAQIDGEALITGVLHLVRGVVSQHDDGLARLDSVERLIHGVVLGVADLGQIRLRHTEGAVVVLSNGGILHHVLGGVFGERAAGDLDGGLGCLVHSNQAIVIGIGAQRTGDDAAGHIDPRLLVRSIVIVHGSNIAVDRAAADFQLAERRTGAVYPGGHGAVDRTALDIGVVPVLNGEAVGGVHGAAQQVQCTAIHLDGDEVILGKRTTLDGQGGPSTDAVVAQTDQGGTLDAGDAAVVLHLAALDDHKAVLALDVDDIVGSLRVRSILTLDGTSLRLAAVFQRDLLVVDGQRGLGILGAAIQRMTIQVKDDGILGNRDILASIRQQGYGRAALGRVNSRLQGLVLGTVDLCHGGFHRFLDLVKGRDCAVISLRLHRDRFAGGLSDLSSFHLIQRGAGGAIGLKAGHRVRAAQCHIVGLRAVLDVQERLARLVGVDCAVVHCDGLGIIRSIALLDIHIDRLAIAFESAVVERHLLGAIRPDVIILAFLLEVAAVECLTVGIQAYLAIDGAIVIHHRIGVLQASVVGICVVESHILKSDLRTAQSHRTGHVEADICAIGSLHSDSLTRIGQTTVQRIATFSDLHSVTISGRCDSRVQRLIAGLSDVRYIRSRTVHRIGRISAALSTGGIIRRAADAAASDLLVAGVTAVLAVSDLQVIGVTAAVAVVGHARSVLGDARALGVDAVRHRSSVRRRRQQRQHHYQRKQ